MLVLGVDSSTNLMSMGIVDDQKMLGEISFPCSRETLGKWIFWLDFLLKESKVDIERIDVFSCVCGPGVFTNLRLGLSSIKGLAFALKKPVVAISSLDVYAERVSFPKIRVLIPSCRGSFFYCVYEKKNRLSPPALGTIEEMRLLGIQEEIWVGPGQIEFSKMDVPENIQTIALPPSGSFVASLGLKKALCNETTDAVSLRPEYIRVARAQEKL